MGRLSQESGQKRQLFQLIKKERKEKPVVRLKPIPISPWLENLISKGYKRNKIEDIWYKCPCQWESDSGPLHQYHSSRHAKWHISSRTSKENPPKSVSSNTERQRENYLMGSWSPDHVLSKDALAYGDPTTPGSSTLLLDYQAYQEREKKVRIFLYPFQPGIIWDQELWISNTDLQPRRGRCTQHPSSDASWSIIYWILKITQ